MNYSKKTLVYFIIHTIIGVIALIAALLVHLPDGYKEGLVSGISGGFIFTGILGAITSIRLMKNPQKAMKVEIAKNEERTQLIRMKTRSAIYTITLYIESFGTLAAGFLGFREISVTLACLLIVQVALYIGFSNYYWKKY